MNEKIEKTIDLLTTYLLTYGINVVGAIATLVFGYLMAGWLARLTHQAMRRSGKIDAVFHQLPGRVVRTAVMVFTLIAVLNRFGVETT
ncbi:mechanosensitive ion channel family protein, partial [Roseateles sp. GG27B]